MNLKQYAEKLETLLENRPELKDTKVFHCVMIEDGTICFQEKQDKTAFQIGLMTEKFFHDEKNYVESDSFKKEINAVVV